MSTEAMLEREARADQWLNWHLIAAIGCGLVLLLVGGGLISQQSNPLAAQLTQSAQLVPVTGQVMRVESDPCAYRTGAVFGMGGACGSGVKFWLSGATEPVVATARGAPAIQGVAIPVGGFAMAMVAPRAIPAGAEAHMLTVDGATIVQYGSFTVSETGDPLAAIFLLAVPVLLFPVHLMMRQAARGRAQQRIAAGATWGR